MDRKLGPTRVPQLPGWEVLGSSNRIKRFLVLGLGIFAIPPHNSFCGLYGRGLSMPSTSEVTKTEATLISLCTFPPERLSLRHLECFTCPV